MEHFKHWITIDNNRNIQHHQISTIMRNDGYSDFLANQTTLFAASLDDPILNTRISVELSLLHGVSIPLIPNHEHNITTAVESLADSSLFG